MVQTVTSPRPIDVVGPVSSAGGGSSKSSTGCHWWQELEIGLLVLLAAAVYFTRMDAVSLRGEETRRAGIAIEMIRSGDWVVPRLQDAPAFFRPPLQNWVIAFIGLWRGQVDAVAIRLPSVLALLLTTLVIYIYSRSFLSRLGALSAAAAFATMSEIMQLGRLGETDILLTLFISSSLLVWHYGQSRGWPAVWTWSSGYLLAALAVLTKGLQGIFYFIGPIAIFLVVTRRWREILRLSHLAGILVFLAVFGAWQVPYYLAEGWQGVRAMYWTQVAIRFEDSPWITIAKHLLTYPAEVLGCMLPWSVLLVAYLDRGFRKTLGPAREHVLFLVCCIAVTFPSCWFVWGARSRYFMPLYPCFAPLIGLVVQRCYEADSAQAWRMLWPRFVGVLAVLMLIAGIFIAGATAIDDGSLPVGQPVWVAVIYLLATAVLSLVTWWSRGAATTAQIRSGVLSVAIFLGLTSTVVMSNVLIRTSEPTAEAVADLKRRLPANAGLVSLGPIDHLFAYYYGDPIPMLSYPSQENAIPPIGGYFCSGNDASGPVEVNFPWEKVAVISCERRHKPQPRRVVVVGRRLPG